MILDRRQALAGLVTIGAVVPVLHATRAVAQTQPASSAGISNYVPETLSAGMVALRTSEIAVQKATHPNVKQFAELEIAEQKTIASVLAATPAGKNAPELKPQQQQAIDQLNGMQAGTDFDNAYVEAQIKGHNELLEIQHTLSGERQPSIEAVTARISEQAVASHIAMLNLIQQLTGAQHIENIQQGKNPDGSTAPAQGASGGNDAPANGQ